MTRNDRHPNGPRVRCCDRCGRVFRPESEDGAECNFCDGFYHVDCLANARASDCPRCSNRSWRSL